ncbi:MAG TPA: hypothetical protein VGM54_05050 [Chthoniobacter sp.]|jgi:hypothetical protein
MTARWPGWPDTVSNPQRDARGGLLGQQTCGEFKEIVLPVACCHRVGEIGSVAGISSYAEMQQPLGFLGRELPEAVLPARSGWHSPSSCRVLKTRNKPSVEKLLAIERDGR